MRASCEGPLEQALGVRHGRAARDGHGNLVAGSGPGKWFVLGPVRQGRELRRRLEEIAETSGQKFVTILIPAAL